MAEPLTEDEYVNVVQRGAFQRFGHAGRRRVLTRLGELASLPVRDAQGDYVCRHGTAMDVHCCHCHNGFLFDPDHECPPAP